mmetsp:Transcript_18998/g.44529  ORF Transcript_18998/g.44529 Transcript_18998/m.44529 type:complete len:300 (+) Transcript_18998:1-900(+)
MALLGRTIFLTGGSRGIGHAIAVRCARDGANVIVAAKTADPHPKLAGTIFSAAEDIEKAGGKALPLQLDCRSTDDIDAAIAKAVQHFGGIDILINNASALSPTPTEKTSPQKYDLMASINTRGTYFTTKAAIPHLKKAKNPHVLNLSPPLNMDPRWFALGGVAYTMSKYGMSMCVLGHAEEFREDGIAFNALWPAFAVATAAVENALGDAAMLASRKVDIMSDAAYWILTQDSRKCTGNFFIDEEVLKANGATQADIDAYSVKRGMPLIPDLYVGEPSHLARWMKAQEMMKKASNFFKS